MKHVERVVEALLKTDAHSAVRFVSPRQVVRATRVLTRGRIDRRYSTTVVVTLGRPNYRERAEISDLRKAGEPFPVKKVKLRPVPKRKAS